MAQTAALKGRPAYDITVISGGRHISDMGGRITIHAPYELQRGEHPNGIVVWYVDKDGKKERCETSYDSVKKRVSWKTDHLSLYMIDYEEPGSNPDGGDGTYVIHRVQKGDTLWALSKRYKSTIAKIVALNRERNLDPNRIYVGWELKIPGDERKNS